MYTYIYICMYTYRPHHCSNSTSWLREQWCVCSILEIYVIYIYIESDLYIYIYIYVYIYIDYIIAQTWHTHMNTHDTHTWTHMTMCITSHTWHEDSFICDIHVCSNASQVPHMCQRHMQCLTCVSLQQCLTCVTCESQYYLYDYLYDRHCMCLCQRHMQCLTMSPCTGPWYVCIHTYIHIFSHKNTLVHVYTRACIHVRSMYVHVYVYILYTCLYIHNIRVYIFVYVFIYTQYIYIHVFIHTHTICIHTCLYVYI